MMINRECKKYLKELRLAFPVFRKTEQRFYNDFRNSMLEYQNDSQTVTREKLEDRFGMPKDVVIEYFNNMGAETYMKLIRKTTAIKRFIVAVVAFLVFSFVCQTYSINQMRKEVADTKIVTESSIIEYESAEQ